MARGKNTARSPAVTPKKRPDPAEEAESRLRHLHAVGREALARFPVGAAIDPNTVHEIAEREGLRLDRRMVSIPSKAKRSALHNGPIIEVQRPTSHPSATRIEPGRGIVIRGGVPRR